MNQPNVPLAPINTTVSIQPLTVVVPGRDSVTADTPLANLAAGTTVDGFVINRDAKNNPILRTPLGDFLVESAVFLKTGSNVKLRVDPSQLSRARIVSVDGMTPEDYEAHNIHGITRDTVGATSLQPTPRGTAGTAPTGTATLTEEPTSYPVLEAVVLQAHDVGPAAPKNRPATILTPSQRDPVPPNLSQLPSGTPLKLTVIDVELPPVPISLAAIPEATLPAGLLPATPTTAPAAPNAPAAPITPSATAPATAPTLSATPPSLTPQTPDIVPPTPPSSAASLLQTLLQPRTPPVQTGATPLPQQPSTPASAVPTSLFSNVNTPEDISATPTAIPIAPSPITAPIGHSATTTPSPQPGTATPAAPPQSLLTGAPANPAAAPSALSQPAGMNAPAPVSSIPASPSPSQPPTTVANPSTASAPLPNNSPAPTTSTIPAATPPTISTPTATAPVAAPPSHATPAYPQQSPLLAAQTLSSGPGALSLPQSAPASTTSTYQAYGLRQPVPVGVANNASVTPPPAAPAPTTTPPTVTGNAPASVSPSFAPIPAKSPLPAFSLPPSQPTNSAEIRATVIGHEADGANILHTSFATLKLYTQQPLPNGTVLVAQAEKSSDAPPPNLTPLPDSLKDITSFTRDWQNLADAIGSLQASNPALAATILQRMPTVGPKFTSSALFFIAAIKGGTLREWLGDRTSRQLEIASPQLFSLLTQDIEKMQQFFVHSPLADWSGMMLPFMFGQEMHQARLYVRHEEEKGVAGVKNAGGQRFVVEFDLSQLGEMQFDGFVRNGEKTKTFDLVVRAAQNLTPEISQGIRDAFTSTLEATSLAGQLVFQYGAQHFIRPLASPPSQPSGDGAQPILA